MRYIVATLFLFCFTCSFSQVTPTDSVKIDTVIIYKAPLRIKKTIFVEDTGRVKPTLWISGYGALFSNFNYYSSCSCYQTYFNDFKKATTTKVGNMEGLSLNYLHKRLYVEVSVFQTNYKESFKYYDSSSSTSYNTTNAYNYSSISIAPGYLLLKRKVSVIVSAGYVLNHLNSYKGLTLSLADNKVTDINSERKFLKYTSGGIVSFKFLYNIYGRLDAIADLFYMADLHSVTPVSQPFILQRNTAGVKLGLGFRF